MGIKIGGNTVKALFFKRPGDTIPNTVTRCFFNGVSVFPNLTTAVTQPSSAMTSNTAPSPYKAYYSSVYSSNYAAWKAFQNKIDTRGWASCSANSGKTAWIALDLGSGKYIRDVVVKLWNRNNKNVNGPNNITIYGTNSTPTNGTGSTGTTMPSATPLGVFTGLSGSTSSRAYILDTVGNTTSNCTRSTSYIENSQKEGYRYIIISSTSWNQAGGTYLSIGCIKIDGKFNA